MNSILKASQFVFLFENSSLKKVALYHSLNMQKIYGNRSLSKLFRCFLQPSTITRVLGSFPKKRGTEVLSVIKSLKERDFLVDNEMNENATFEGFRRKLPQVQVTTLRLLVTNKCNFLCKYCQIERNLDTPGRELSMSTAVARKALQLFASLCDPRKLKTIVLTGGEPTMNIQVVKYLISHKDIIPKPARIVLFTNGSPISKEFARFLANHNVKVLVSIDGPKEVHDKTRFLPSGKGTFEIAVKQYQMYKRIGCDVGISAVITPKSLDLPVNRIAEFFLKLQPKSIGFNFPHYLIKSGHSAQINIHEYMRRLISLYNMLRKEGIFIEQISRVLVPFLKGKPRVRECAAQGKGITIDARGLVGHCKSLLVSDVPVNNNKKIEDARNIREDELFSKWSHRSPFFMSDCQDCPAISVCGGGCAYDSWCIYRDPWQVHPRTCVFSKSLLNFLMWDLYENACINISDDFFEIAVPDEEKVDKYYKDYLRNAGLKRSVGH